MEESTKKAIMIGVIVVCLVAAAIIYVKNMPRGGRGRTSAGATTWLKCTNPDCGAAYEMSESEYIKWVQESTYSMGPVPIRCEKCGEYSAYQAIKCEKCGTVFVMGTVPDDFADRCPECGYSKTEEIWEKGRRK